MARLHMPAKSVTTKYGGPAVVAKSLRDIGSGCIIMHNHVPPKENPVFSTVVRSGEDFEAPPAVIKLNPVN